MDYEWKFTEARPTGWVWHCVEKTTGSICRSPTATYSPAFTMGEEQYVAADMVKRGEVKLDDPISRYLPASVRVPQRNGKQITLVDLATQSSGLPRLPTNLAPADMNNPYADYSVKQLYDFLSSYTLTRDIGAQYEYSNLGMGLLGHVLSLRALTRATPTS